MMQAPSIFLPFLHDRWVGQLIRSFISPDKCVAWSMGLWQMQWFEPLLTERASLHFLWHAHRVTRLLPCLTKPDQSCHNRRFRCETACCCNKSTAGFFSLFCNLNYPCRLQYQVNWCVIFMHIHHIKHWFMSSHYLLNSFMLFSCFNVGHGIVVTCLKSGRNWVRVDSKTDFLAHSVTTRTTSSLV